MNAPQTISAWGAFHVTSSVTEDHSGHRISIQPLRMAIITASKRVCALRHAQTRWNSVRMVASDTQSASAIGLLDVVLRSILVCINNLSPGDNGHSFSIKFNHSFPIVLSIAAIISVQRWRSTRHWDCEGNQFYGKGLVGPSCVRPHSYSPWLLSNVLSTPKTHVIHRASGIAIPTRRHAMSITQATAQPRTASHNPLLTPLRSL